MEEEAKGAVSNNEDSKDENENSTENREESLEQASSSSNGNDGTDSKNTKRRNYRRRISDSSDDDRNAEEEQNEPTFDQNEAPAPDEVPQNEEIIASRSPSTDYAGSNNVSSESSSSSDSDSDFSFDSPLSPLLRFGINISRNFGFTSDTSDSMDDDDADSRENSHKTATEVLNKEIPSHKNFSWPNILMNRERGYFCKMNESRFLNHRKNFEKSFYGSQNAVERLELMSKLDEHFGCVNCLGFSRNGLYLLSGSDDLRVILWNWYNSKALTLASSKHKKNIFQTKFYDESSQAMKAISASADGTISIHQFLSDGGHTEKQVYTHGGPVHKVAVSDVNNVVYTCGEDGLIIEFDYRSKTPNKLITVREKHRKISLFSISAHPNECKYAVSGKDQFVRVFDRRNHKSVLAKYCPEELKNGNTTSRYISCCVYNYNGTELLASYNDENIYLFDANDYTLGTYLHKYQGHRNSKTIKGVNFFGPKSEYIITGYGRLCILCIFGTLWNFFLSFSSDCGHIYFYDKQNESIVQFMKGDEGKIVNVLEPHPIYPVLATSVSA